MLPASVLLVFACCLTSCDSNPSQQDPFVVTYNPAFNAANFQATITNTFFPLAPGTMKVFEGQVEGGTERIEIEVLSETRVVNGVTATIVRDRVFLNNDLIEDTFDWYAQDTAGNVWYLGEDSKEIMNGQVINMAGSWEAGVDGAVAGIIMPASPAIGQAYQQEFYANVAEDRGKILSVNESVTVPAGSYTGCVKTEDTTPLEPDVLEHKYYCPGVGQVLGENLTDNERVELKSVSSTPSKQGQ